MWRNPINSDISCIYVTLGDAKRSGNVIGKRLSKYLKWKSYDDDKLTPSDYDNLRLHSTLFFFNHNPSFYKNRSFVGAERDIVNCRYDHVDDVILGKKCINGLSYYNNFPFLYDSFFPTITKYKFLYNSDFKYRNNLINPSIGYYFRDIRYDGAKYFISEFIPKIPDNISIFILGISSFPYLKRKNIYCTFDNEYFFNNITHYFYFKSNIILDPFPHSLLEAIQNKCTLIIPENKERKMKDGIDDIISVLGNRYISKIEKNFLDKEYHLDFDFEFNFSSLVNYQHDIICSGFSLLPDKRWKTLNDLLSHI